MVITVHDHTFATTSHGEEVAFATAGDCYSAVDCPQVPIFLKSSRRAIDIFLKLFYC